MVLAGDASCAVARRRYSYGLSEKDQSVDTVVGDMEILSSGMVSDGGTVGNKRSTHIVIYFLKKENE